MKAKTTLEYKGKKVSFPGESGASDPFDEKKYEFNEEEKREIAVEMARQISEMEQAESEKKAILSDIKGRIDSLKQNIQSHTTKLNNGYEYKNMKVYCKEDFIAKLVRFFRPDTCREVKTRPMTMGLEF